MYLTPKEVAVANKQVDIQNQELLRKLQMQYEMPTQAESDELEQGKIRLQSITGLESQLATLQGQLKDERKARHKSEIKTRSAEAERDLSTLRADEAEDRTKKLLDSFLGGQALAK